MDQEQNEKRAFALKFMENLIKYSPYNVPQPMLLIGEKAQNRLNTDDLISWRLMLKEWQKVSAEGKKEISKLLFLASYDLVEVLNATSMMGKEARDTVEFVGKHPEYAKSKEELDCQNMVRSVLEDMGLE